jgi:hypothetical protein
LQHARNLALIGYTSAYFLPFARHLEAEGFSVYWVHSLRSFTRYLLRNGVPAERILDLSDPRRFEWDAAVADRELSDVEAPDLPRSNDIILMDRHLRRRPYRFALAYLACASRSLRAFIAEHRISMLSSGRDTALQILSMLVARRCGIVWAGVAYLRLPIERFMLTATHVSDEVLPLGEIRPEHLQQARQYLAAFRKDSLKPYLRPSSTSWRGVMQRLPVHLIEGWRLLVQARHDAGNAFARYTLADILGIYLRKKLNLIQADLFLKTYREPGTRPYVYFGLHRQPESSVDVVGAFFSDQAGFVRTLARSLPAGHDLLVKLHASDADGWPLSFYRTLEALPGVRLIDPVADSRRLLRDAALTITNSGTMAYEAGLLGLPAITFSKLHFNQLPSVHYCDSPVALPALIDRLLTTQTQTDDEAIEAFLARMLASSFPGMPNRAIFRTDLTPEDLASLASAYHALHAYCVQRQLTAGASRTAGAMR